MPPINVSLPVSRLIDVSVSLAAQAAQAQNLSTLLIPGSSAVIDVVTRIRSYSTITQVNADFGGSAPETLAATLWFEQNPQPTQLYIGRWAASASAGQLYCAPQTPATLLAALEVISTGSFTVSIDGTPHNITGLSFTGATTLPGCAAVIQTALASAAAGTTCVWNAVYNYFVITSPTTGTASAISFLTAEGSGADVSVLMGGRSTSSGAYVANGIAAETALACVTLFDLNYGQLWYAVTVLGSVDADSEVIAPYIEAATNFHFFGVTTQAAGVLTSGTSDVAYILAQAAYNRTAVQYSSTNAYAAVSLLARILTTNYAGNATVITLIYKQEPGITAETLTVTQITNLESKNCNVFVNYNNATAIIEPGVSCSGNFIDTVTGTAALAVNIQAACSIFLYTSPTKIPQTDAGTALIVNAPDSVLNAFVANGLLAPGVWTSAGFGQITNGTYLSKGYYVFAPLAATQSASARAARLSVPIQIAAKLAGAVRTIDVAVTVVS